MTFLFALCLIYVKKQICSVIIGRPDEEGITMEIQTLLLFFASIFCAEVEGEVGTHYYISEAMSWKDAQTHCRKYYTDLSPINDQKDTEKILKAAERQTSPKWNTAWIGLYRDPTNPTRWKWSGGGYVTYTNWAKGQPDNTLNRELNREYMSVDLFVIIFIFTVTLS
uniref:C-type lectin domain-containing protein n=1 Tax=Salarias fasciatus TaxID=181472 RepID=A0A672FTL1_SALFA